MNHSNFFIQSLTSLMPVGFAPAILIVTAALISTATVANTAIEEVIVTADFRDASLLKTAASITVFDNQTITRRQVRHLEQLLNLAPNVNFSSGASRGRFLQIRGIGERSQFIEPLNPSVGILVDGIDFTGIAGAATTMDIAQVEILRGPQGTLYGANALAGLINLRSNQPTETTEGNLAVSLGDYNTQTVSVAMGGPINQQLGYRLALQQHRSDGYVRNDYLQRDDTDNLDELSLRSIFDWQAGANVDLKLTVFHVNADNGYDAFSLDNTRNTLSDTPGHDRHEASALALQSTWRDSEHFNLISLISYADNDLEYGYDEDWAFAAICADQPCEGWEYNSNDNYIRDRKNATVDIKLVSSTSGQVFNGSTDWVVGIYGRQQDEQLLRQYTYSVADFTSDFNTRNHAVYGQLDTQLSSALRLTTGVRFENREAAYRDSDLVIHQVDEDIWGGRMALHYQWSPKTMIFGLISRGYKAGGVNSNSSLSADDREFDSELMLNYELGAKGLWFDDKLQTQVSLFYQDRDEIQLKQSLVQSREQSNATTFIDYIGNSAEGSNRGVEVEFNWLASETLLLFGSVGLLDTEYDIPLSADLDRREQAHAPGYQFALGLSSRLSDSLTLTVDVEGKDKFYLSSSHDEQSQSYELVNVSMAYVTGNWGLSLWARNLTDEAVIVRGFGGFGNDPRKFYETEAYYQLGEPRMLEISASYAF